MTTKSKPASAAERKAIGERLKDARERKAADRQAIFEENIFLKAKIAALSEKVPGDPLGVAGLPPSDTETATTKKPPKPVELPNEQAVKDDLDWIDSSVHAVAIVAKKMTITLRAYNTRVFPPVESVAIHSSYAGPWDANPFDLRSTASDHKERAEKEKYNEMMNANWGHFRITREMAKDVYGDPRHPVPTEAVISAREFKGYDSEVHRAVGTYRPLGPAPDVLRECVRATLQRLERCFVDASHHREQILSRRFDPRRPNPYRMRLGDLSARLPAVAVEGETKA